MNNLSDKYVVIIFVVTVIFVFILIFSVRSPEREIIDQPLMWREDFTNSNYEIRDKFGSNSSLI